MQESAYKMGAKGIRCGISITTGLKDCVAIDFGIGQINHTTIKGYKFNQKKLMTDLEYSVEAAAIVLSSFKPFEKKEPKTWVCRYNVGTRDLAKVKTPCQNYLKLVARHM